MLGEYAIGGDCIDGFGVDGFGETAKYLTLEMTVQPRLLTTMDGVAGFECELSGIGEAGEE